MPVVAKVCAWCGVTQPPDPSDEELARIHEQWNGPEEEPLVSHGICEARRCPAERRYAGCLGTASSL